MHLELTRAYAISGSNHLCGLLGHTNECFERWAPFNPIDLQTLPTHAPRSLGHVSHPVQAYLNGLAPSSRRPQLSALDWIARRSTQLYTAETKSISSRRASSARAKLFTFGLS
jgi:hypothetical protein